MARMPNDPRVVVLGAGPAGLAAALTLATAGVEVTLVAPAEAARPADQRTTALLGGSVNLLENLGVWPHLEACATPLAGIRIADDKGDLLRAPELFFKAKELGLAAFGANIANGPLVSALVSAAQNCPKIQRIAATAEAVLCTPEGATVQLGDDRSLQAQLVVAADGRNSLARKASGLVPRAWTYPQTAVVATFRHARPHHCVSTELHRRNGPLTTVPLPAHASSLVWVTSPDEAHDLMRLDLVAFANRLEQELQGLLGAITLETPLAAFALSGLATEPMARARVALVGEAGHVVPPIGAQGLNLGFRDAATLADVVGEAWAAGDDPGSPAVLDRYSSARRRDILTRQMSVDVLNRSLISDFLPLQALRGVGLHLIANVRVLREAVMRSGVGPSDLPRLMRSKGVRSLGVPA